MFVTEKYFFDSLCDKYKIETDSRISKIESALRTWFKREHKVKMLELEIIGYIYDDPSEFQVKIEIPMKNFGLDQNLTKDELIDIFEGENQEILNNKVHDYFENLINFKKDFLYWDFYREKEKPNKLIIIYAFK